MPNSILWIGLVVLWVFVLFPMLAGRHPRIRQTTDAALATRVLHRGDAKRLIRKRPAAGHDTDPDYVPTRRVEHPHTDDAEDRMTRSDDETATGDDDFEADREVDTVVAPNAESGADLDDEFVDADEDRVEAADEFDADDPGIHGEAPVDGYGVDDDDVRDDYERDAAYEADMHDDPPSDADPRSDYDVDSDAGSDSGTDDRDHVADDESVPAAARASTVMARIPAARTPEPYDEDESEYDERDFVPSRRGRGGYDPEADAIARAARYRFRQRAVLGLACSVVLFAAGGLLVSSRVWGLCALSAAVLVGYLAYLRKQVRIEEDIRRRRTARLARNRHRGDADDDEEESPRRVVDHRSPDRESARTRLRRATLLEPDDEDPMFEHLEMFDAATARETRERAAGARMRRAVGE
ncbi:MULTISPECIES: gephyrin-like molybdotransferase receptor GlpR [unclassified Nocardia]|uniref:divisome protein SepX/GlpR n=1 Tax=unclassified Nocardia TaxID=2637762 RepID=UPI00278BCAE9|nr:MULTISPECIES: gephyrin-like molybdotransferase receptor GlpR [unclassified Nocardia]